MEVAFLGMDDFGDDSMPNYKSTPHFCAVYNQPGSGNSAAGAASGQGGNS